LLAVLGNGIKKSVSSYLKLGDNFMAKKYKTTFAFIDSQNLNLGVGKNLYKKGKLVYRGWKLDFRKFRKYLDDKFRVNKAFIFIGYIKENQDMYKSLQSYGYSLIFKPTVKDDQGKPKGNIDAELVLYSAAIEFDNYDEAVIVSGDGDFACLNDFLLKKDKLKKIIIPNSKSASSLLNKFEKYKIFVEFDKEKLEFEQKK
jgi:uncharacterized LabA/DUF88 family protein